MKKKQTQDPVFSSRIDVALAKRFRKAVKAKGDKIVTVVERLFKSYLGEK